MRSSRWDSWKIDDLIFTGVEHASLPAPLSMVEEHRKEKAGRSIFGEQQHPTAGPPGRTPPKLPSLSLKRAYKIDWSDRIVALVLLGIVVAICGGINDWWQKRGKGSAGPGGAAGGEQEGRS